MAFVGALAARRNVAFPELLALAYSAAWFAGGVFAAGLMAAVAYFTNSFYSAGYRAMNDKSREYFRRGSICNWFGVVLGFMLLGAFIGGLFFAARALLQLGRIEAPDLNL